ncbi:MAG: A/G-specific adenine glycosylase [Candidatus Sumerlaeota bacterium]|nr:A/G-specific adenine glycosylase [Candidatus Sumerlaeota bacterium]
MNACPISSTASKEKSKINYNTLRRSLLTWFDRHKRSMPWRGESDPYRIWVSEVMLQQTQVKTVIPYYLRFIERFPTVEALARAPEDEVLRLWAGLGYYSRARNLAQAARIICECGAFPDTYDELLDLPGLGRYTAGAVASIAFGLPRPCVDGNVLRVVARLLALRGDPRKGKPRARIEQAAADWMDARRPGDFNQAMMELGATVCVPDRPDCLHCPLRRSCRACARNVVSTIPPRRPSKTESRIAVIGVLKERGRVLIARRPEGKRFAGMWEFPGGKVEKGETLEAALAREFKEETGLVIMTGEKLAVIKHTYTKFRIALHAFEVHRRSGRPEALAVTEVKWVPLKRLADYAFPAANQRLIEILKGKCCAALRQQVRNLCALTE